MSNILRLTDDYGRTHELLSRDLDPVAAAEEMSLPISVVDKTDGGRLYGEIREGIETGLPTFYPAVDESVAERDIDRAVQARLRFDYAYKYAEDADAQSTREEQITEEEEQRYYATHVVR